jgi:initiation factor 1A
MPKRNIRGGKGFKKGRKEDPTKELGMKFEGKEAGQQYGRIVTVLGDRRFKCFCDDGRERVCKVRGVLCWGPKRQKMEVGDIVLISGRDFTAPDSDDEGTAAASSTRVEISDIITKIPQHYWRDIRREAGVHPELFCGLNLTVAPTEKRKKGGDTEDIFAEEDDSDAGDSDDSDDDAAETIQHVSHGKRQPKWAAAVAAVDDDDSGKGHDDIDVDAI